VRPLFRELALFAFFLLASGFALRPLPFHLADSMPAGTDPPHHLYILNWLLDHGFSEARFEGRMFHPARNAVLRSDLSMGTVVLLAPLAPFIDDPVVRFNLATWISLAFSGWAFCLLARSWTGSVVAGIFAGVTAVLGSHQALHYVHLNLMSVGWLPIFVLALDRILTEPTPRFIVLAGASFALVASSSGYYGVAASVLAVIFFLRNPSIRGFRAGALAAFVAAVVLWPYLHAYADLHSREDMVRTSRELAKGSLTLADLGSRTWLHRGWNGARGEPLFPGIAVLVLSLGALRWGQARERTLALSALLLFWLSLGEPGLLYRVFAHIPPFSSMRHPVTMAAVALFLLSILAALGLAALQKTRPAAAWFLFSLGLIESVTPRNDFFEVPKGVPPVYEAVLSMPPGPVLEVPPYQASPLIWATRRGFETLNGGGAFIPALTTRIETTTQNHWLLDTYELIDESKAAGILLNETSMRYLILPAGRSGGYEPLVQRFRESRCFKEIGVYAGDVLFEALRESSCPAWAGSRPAASPS
jgi:hypothetical protein